MRMRKNFLAYCLPSIDNKEIDEVIDTLKGGWLTSGPKTIKFERQLAKYIKVRQVVALNSCTAGLHLSLIALGIGQGDEVITTPYTFAATANVIEHVGAKPVFVDVEEDTCNIDPKEIKKAITKKTKAIMVVHFAGHPVDMTKIKKIAQEHNLKIIEDAAHAFGAEFEGKKIGSMGNLTSFSFYATKNLTTGEGGAITVNNDKLAKKIKILRLHGFNRSRGKDYRRSLWLYEIVESGWKYNMIDIQASLGIHQLKKQERFIRIRRKYAKIYNTELSKIKGIKIPKERSNIKHVYHIYPIFLKKYNRSKFIKEMNRRNIGVSVHFISLHLQPYYRKKYGYKAGSFPIAEKLSKTEVSLPLYPLMSKDDIKYVISAIKDILA